MLRYLVFTLVMLTAVQSAYSIEHIHIVNQTVSHQHKDSNFHTHVVDRISHTHSSTTFTIVDGERIGTHSHDVFQVENELNEEMLHPHTFTYVDYAPTTPTLTGALAIPTTTDPTPTLPEDPALVPILAGTAPPEDPNLPGTEPADPTTPAGGSTDNPLNTGGTGTALGAAQGQQSVYNNPGTPNPNEPTTPQNNSVPIEVVEYMVRDWSMQSGAGLPQWIELYNPNPDPMNLKGWTFQYARQRSANSPYTITTLTIEDDIEIQAEAAFIFVTHSVPEHRFSGITAEQVYDLDIPNALKLGWVITDATGVEIHRIGRRAFGTLGDPHRPLHQDGARVSHHMRESMEPPDSYYYGAEQDIGSPGFHEPVIPSAPSLIKPKKVGVWADLKRGVER